MILVVSHRRCSTNVIRHRVHRRWQNSCRNCSNPSTSPLIPASGVLTMGPGACLSKCTRRRIFLSCSSALTARSRQNITIRLAGNWQPYVMKVASGNVVHNLRMVKWEGNSEPYPWAASFNQYVLDNLDWKGPAKDHPLVNFMQHDGAALSNPSVEHYLPLLYVLGAWDGEEAITTPTDGIVMSSLSMLSVQIG